MYFPDRNSCGSYRMFYILQKKCQIIAKPNAQNITYQYYIKTYLLILHICNIPSLARPTLASYGKPQLPFLATIKSFKSSFPKSSRHNNMKYRASFIIPLTFQLFFVFIERLPHMRIIRASASSLIYTCRTNYKTRHFGHLYGVSFPIQ